MLALSQHDFILKERCPTPNLTEVRAMTLKIRLFDESGRYVELQASEHGELRITQTSLWELVEPAMDRLDKAGKFPIFSSDGGPDVTRQFITDVFQGTQVSSKRGTAESFALKLQAILTNAGLGFYHGHGLRYRELGAERFMEFCTKIDSEREEFIDMPIFKTISIVVYP